MNRLKVLVMLFFVVALLLSATFNRTVNSQGQDPSTASDTSLTASESASLASLTNQADKVSETGFPVSASFDKFGPRCGPGIDCEGANPFDTNPFTFDAGEDVRPPAADGCQVVCPPPMACPEPICTE